MPTDRARLILPLLLLALIPGCQGSFQYAGQKTSDYFPLDGERTWRYLQQDTSVEWQLFVEKLPTPTEANGYEIFTLEYSQYDPTQLLYSIDWSSDTRDGVLIHGYAIEGGDTVAFDTPVIFGEDGMTTDEDVITETNGRTYTSSLEGTVTCQNEWTTDKWECLHMSIDDGVNDSTSAPFVGDWWIAAKWGTSWMQPVTFDQPWVLANGTWSEEAE